MTDIKPSIDIMNLMSMDQQQDLHQQILGSVPNVAAASADPTSLLSASLGLGMPNGDPELPMVGPGGEPDFKRMKMEPGGVFLAVQVASQHLLELSFEFGCREGFDSVQN